MIATNQTVDTLQSLIKINNDRVTGYEKAAEQIKSSDADLYPIFTKMAAESREYAATLNNLLQQFGEEVETDTTAPGKIYRAWMDVKNAFAGSNRKSILSSCEYGEDAAQKAYKEALEDAYDDDNELHSGLRNTILQQQQSLKEAHDKIKSLRDSAF